MSDQKKKINLQDSDHLMYFLKRREADRVRCCNGDNCVCYLRKLNVSGKKCTSCNEFFYLSIQTYYPYKYLGDKLGKLKPLFDLIYEDFFDCFAICPRTFGQQFCLRHFELFVQRFKVFFSSPDAPFKLTLRIKASLSTIYYCLIDEFMACNICHHINPDKCVRGEDIRRRYRDCFPLE